MSIPTAWGLSRKMSVYTTNMRIELNSGCLYDQHRDLFFNSIVAGVPPVWGFGLKVCVCTTNTQGLILKVYVCAIQI